MILFSSQTGLIEALLLEKGYLTEIRTALAWALAAENLANPEMITTGSQWVINLRTLIMRSVSQLFRVSVKSIKTVHFLYWAKKIFVE
jgi:ornithine cyclodeaminase